jgi:hypothetical protein
VTDRPSETRGSDKEPKPFHAKEVSSGQETADVLASVLKHAAARDAAAQKKAPPKPQPIWMLPLGLTLAVLATFLLIAPPPWVVVNPIAAQEPEDALANAGRAIYVSVSRIEGWRQVNGRLPQTLAEAGVGAVEGLDYSVNGSSYTLITSVGDRDLIYPSSENLLEWASRNGVTFQIGG